MKNLTLLFWLFTISCIVTNINTYAQHDHHVDDNKNSHNHLAHMQTSRAQNF